MAGAAEEKYKEAIGLYASTDLTITEISKRCGVSRAAFARYIQCRHRDLMLRRHGYPSCDSNDSRAGGQVVHEIKLRGKNGQSRATHEKYRDAIEACDSKEYIALNISQIANIFHLNPTALANQLRAHYPEILTRRETLRMKTGIADNAQRGMRKSAKTGYADAVDALRSSDLTIEEAADKFGVSFTGLRQHLLFYHKDIVELREKRRKEGADVPKTGRLSGNGQIRNIPERQRALYAEAVRLYATTNLAENKIAEKTGVSQAGLRNHLMKWHRNLMFERRGAEMPTEKSDREPFGDTKRSDRATREKYAEVIEVLKREDCSVEAAAKRFGFVPEVLRSYLKDHEPKLFLEMGMKTRKNGKKTLRRSQEKYAEALKLYAKSDKSMKEIAEIFGLNYSSFTAYIRRNGLSPD